MMISLRLLGAVSLEDEDGVLTGPPAQQHRLALLALLAAAPFRTHTREKLMAMLWPGRGTASARKLLNQSVYVLRRALGKDALISQGEELRLNTEAIHCDVVAFEEALGAGQPERSVELYTGPFLDGFFLRGAGEFQHWVDRERVRLSEARARALEELAEAAEGRDDIRKAVEWWKALSAHDPYDSRVALRLMEALVRSGNPAAAVQHAEVHDSLLRDELGMAASLDLMDLAGRLRTEESPEQPGTGRKEE